MDDLSTDYAGDRSVLNELGLQMICQILACARLVYTNGAVVYDGKRERGAATLIKYLASGEEGIPRSRWTAWAVNSERRSLERLLTDDDDIEFILGLCGYSELAGAFRQCIKRIMYDGFPVPPAVHVLRMGRNHHGPKTNREGDDE